MRAWILGDIVKAGVDRRRSASQLQEDGAKSFVKSWQELLQGDRGQEPGMT